MILSAPLVCPIIGPCCYTGNPSVDPLTGASRCCVLCCSTMERTYIMIKPDGVQRNLVGEIIARFEKKGYKLAALKVDKQVLNCQEEKAPLRVYQATMYSYSDYYYCCIARPRPAV